MNAVSLPLAENEWKQLPVNTAPVHGVPAIAEGAPGAPPCMTLQRRVSQ